MHFTKDGYPIYIKGYNIQREIGHGGFSRVYEAEVVDSPVSQAPSVQGTKVAIKMMDIHSIKEKRLEARVQEEINIHSQLQHPSILELYTSFQDENNIYLVLDICPKGDLEKYMKYREENNQPCSENEIARYFLQIVHGVLHLHDKKIIHRDLKLHNLLLHEDGRILIADFGMATRYVPEVDHLTTCGTLPYMSPEVRGKKPHGLASDVYSLGVILHRMMVGRLPHQDGDYSKHRNIPQNVSFHCRNLIELCLEKDVNCRIALRNIPNHPFLSNWNSTLNTNIDIGYYTLSTNNTKRTTSLGVIEESDYPSQYGYRQMYPERDYSNSRSGCSKAFSDNYIPQNNRAVDNYDHFSLNPEVNAHQFGGEMYSKPQDPGGGRYSPPVKIKSSSSKSGRCNGGLMGQLKKTMASLPQQFSNREMMQSLQSNSNNLACVPQSTRYKDMVCPPPPYGGFLSERSERTVRSRERNELIFPLTERPRSHSEDRRDNHYLDSVPNINNNPLDRRKKSLSQGNLTDLDNNECSCHSSHRSHCNKNENSQSRQNIGRRSNSYSLSSDEKRTINQDSLHRVFARDTISTISCIKKRRHHSGTLKRLSDKCTKICTKRLKKHNYTSDKQVLHITADGCVYVEAIERVRGKAKVTTGMKINPNGDEITVYSINNGAGLPIEGCPIGPSPGTPCDTFSFDTLPHLHWEKYTAAYKFVQVQLIHTAKIIHYSAEGKSVLMENKGYFEMLFYATNDKYFFSAHKCEEVKINGVTHKLIALDSQKKNFFDRALQMRDYCLEMEDLMTTMGAKSGHDPFPMRCGTKPDQGAKAVVTSGVKKHNDKENVRPGRGTSGNNNHKSPALYRHSNEENKASPLVVRGASSDHTPFVLTDNGSRAKFTDGTSVYFKGDGEVVYQSNTYRGDNIPQDLRHKLRKAASNVPLIERKH